MRGREILPCHVILSGATVPANCTGTDASFSGFPRAADLANERLGNIASFSSFPSLILPLRFPLGFFNDLSMGDEELAHPFDDSRE